jgi:hypothetical protein
MIFKLKIVWIFSWEQKDVLFVKKKKKKRNYKYNNKSIRVKDHAQASISLQFCFFNSVERACLMSPVWLTKIRENKLKPPLVRWYWIAFTLYQQRQLWDSVDVHLNLGVFLGSLYHLSKVLEEDGVGVDHGLAKHGSDLSVLWVIGTCRWDSRLRKIEWTWRWDDSLPCRPCSLVNDLRTFIFNLIKILPTFYISF